MYFYENNRTGAWVEQISEDVLRVAGAKAVLTHLDGGVTEVAYHGIFTETTLSALRGKIAQVIDPSGGLVFRYEKAVLFCDFSPGHDSLPNHSAEVVSPEQYDLARRFSRKCAEKGFMRAVLLPEQLLMARRWAKRHALVALA